MGREMRIKSGLIATAFLGMLMSLVYLGLAQQPAGGTSASPERPVGGFVPGQERPPIDAAVAARGKAIYGINCQGCHGQDLRGGDLGGPNLLRSQVALSDQNGELIVPIIQGSRQALGMPALGLSIADSQTVAAYIRSVVATIGRQGAPPGEEKPLNIVTGNASEGEAYFDLKCKSCHSPEGDLKGIASKVSNPKTLQNLWISGRTRGTADKAAVATVTVTLASGAHVQGQLVHMDDFLVTLKTADGTTRTFRRNGDVPKVILQDPLQTHKDLLPVYTDKDIHNITAYLVTLK